MERSYVMREQIYLDLLQIKGFKKGKKNGQKREKKNRKHVRRDDRGKA